MNNLNFIIAYLVHELLIVNVSKPLDITSLDMFLKRYFIFTIYFNNDIILIIVVPYTIVTDITSLTR